TPPSKEAYKEIVQNMTSFLQGGYQDIKKDLTNKMLEASDQLNFERAQELRDQIQHMEIIMEQQKMTLNDRLDSDIFGFSYDIGLMYPGVLCAIRKTYSERWLHFYIVW